jgi:hypothetical protein
MLVHLAFWALICTIGFAHPAANPDNDNVMNIQMDLVFPVVNNTYKPVYPFPIVFGFSNASSALAYGQSLSWSLVARNSSSATGLSIQQAVIENPFGLASTGKVGSYYLVIEAVANDLPNITETNGVMGVDSLANATAAQGFMELTYKFTIENCATEENGINFISGSTTFFINQETGEIPNIGANDGSCAEPLGALGIINPQQPSSQHSSGNSCATTTATNTSVVQCGTQIGSTVGELVSQAMLNASHCSGKGITWPDLSLTAHCSMAASNLFSRWILMMVPSTIAAIMYFS